MQLTNVGPTSRLVISAVLLFGCSKSLTHSDPDLSSHRQSASYFTTDPSQSPFYGDSILYVQGTGRSAYLVSPVNTLGTGKFVAWPKGLTIDANTGEIDMLQSEPGSRYNVGFVNAGTGDTAYQQVILAGITYPDGIYFVHSADSVLAPYYNASSTGSWLAGGAKQATELHGGGEQGSGGINAVFNEDGTGNQQLIVDGGNGTLNLKASLDQGLFGSNPQNGDNKEIPIYYRLNDKSQMALQKTNIVVYYFNTLADVPQSLVDACLFSQKAFQQTRQQTKTTTGESPAPAPVSGTATSGGAKTAAKPATPAPTPPRPPMVVLVNAGHH
jgi:hypothetical protein